MGTVAYRSLVQVVGSAIHTDRGEAFSCAPLGNHVLQRAWVAGREAIQEPGLWGATALPGFLVSGGGEAFTLFLYVLDPRYVLGYASV